MGLFFFDDEFDLEGVSREDFDFGGAFGAFEYVTCLDVLRYGNLAFVAGGIGTLGVHMFECQYNRGYMTMQGGIIGASLQSGDTILNWAEGIGFKREDLNPTGSVKDRGMSFQISRLVEEGVRSFAISSSGNAGISAASYCQEKGVALRVFVSRHVDQSKLEALKDIGVEIDVSDRPVSGAYRWAKESGAYNLRPAKDDLGSVGFRSLGEELADEEADVVFFPVSSGTTFVGAAEGVLSVSPTLPRMFAVQTSGCHGIVRDLESDFTSEEASLATGIVAKSVPRKQEVLDIIGRSNGGGLVVDNEQIQAAYDWLHGREMYVSYDAAVSLAGLWKAAKNGLIDIEKERVVCILTGKERG